MTRQAHDQFAKQYLEELLSLVGQVETSRDVPSEVRQIDVWFVPTEPQNAQAEMLGLLGKIAANACLLEPFRNPPTPVEVRNCLLKLYSLHGELLRQARREGNSLAEVNLPLLWILSPSASTRLINGFKAELNSEENWTEGVYFFPNLFKTAIVAINQLPVNQDTLWLRVLGRGTTQQQAINQLIALPAENPLRRNILELLANWRINLEIRQNLDSEDDRELIMNLSPAYQQWREATLLEGREEGQRLMVENLLEGRFGSLDEQLSQIIEPMMQLPPRERIQLLLNLSREELLTRFRG
ncbi:MAG: hypothetical protein F6K45_18980 [Kamptonema sp. SIO1D9]|nr:hypothetical protein [Kamptonema sp. SIO1D9]